MNTTTGRSVVEFAVMAERLSNRLRSTPAALVSELSLLQAKNSGVLPKAGRAGDAEYKFHGAGCSFLLDSGEVVDVDFDPGDRPRFDSWRVSAFLRSRAEPADDATIELALRELVVNGVLTQPRPDWYRLA